MIKFDSITILCGILVCIIAYLHFRDKKKENFSTEIDFDSPSYFTTDPKSLNNPNYTHSAAPPFLKCYNCHMKYDCSGYAYDSNDKHMSVCRKCKGELIPEIPNHTLINRTVLAKAAGRTNRCNRLI